jgi:Terminase small subunit
MSSSKIQPSKRGINLNRLNPRQHEFVNYVLASTNYNYTEAARNAGYKNPRKAAQDLVKNKLVMDAIGKGIKDRLTRIEFTADSVIRHLAAALTLDPIDLFEPDSKGAYRIRSIDKIPEHVRRCITKVKCKEAYNEDGDLVGCYFEFEFMSKDAALQLAMKHFGIAGANDKAISGDSEALQTMKLLSSLLTQVEQAKSNVIDTKFIEAKVIDIKE